VGHDATDFAAYGLSDPRGQYGNRDTLDSTYTDKIDAAFIADVWRIMDQAGNLLVRKHHDYGPRTLLTHQVDHLMVCVYVCGTR
jgi:hypothetical protein